jgi:hypothetical protein
MDLYSLDMTGLLGPLRREVQILQFNGIIGSYIVLHSISKLWSGIPVWEFSISEAIIRLIFGLFTYCRWTVFSQKKGETAVSV